MNPASRWPVLIMLVIGILSNFLEPITRTHAGMIFVWVIPALVVLGCLLWLTRLNWQLVKEHPRLFSATFVGGVSIGFLSYVLYLVFNR